MLSSSTGGLLDACWTGPLGLSTAEAWGDSIDGKCSNYAYSRLARSKREFNRYLSLLRRGGSPLGGSRDACAVCPQRPLGSCADAGDRAGGHHGQADAVSGATT